MTNHNYSRSFVHLIPVNTVVTFSRQLDPKYDYIDKITEHCYNISINLGYGFQRQVQALCDKTQLVSIIFFSKDYGKKEF